MSEGDPTTFGNLKPAKEVIEAVQESIASQMYNGYAPSTGKIWINADVFPRITFIYFFLYVGYEKAREAVAEYGSSDFVKVEAKVRSS